MNEVTVKFSTETANDLLDELLGDHELQSSFESTVGRKRRLKVLEDSIVALQKGLVPIGSTVRSRSIEIPAHGVLTEYRDTDDPDKWGFGVAVVITDDGDVVELPMMWLERIEVVE